MFPKKSPAKKPIKLNSNSKKMNDMNAFIDNELKIMQSLNRRQHPTSLINPININNSMAESQNNLKNVMNKTSFGTQNKTAVEDPMRTSQSKFEGFSNVTKFTDNQAVQEYLTKKKVEEQEDLLQLHQIRVNLLLLNFQQNKTKIIIKKF